MLKMQPDFLFWISCTLKSSLEKSYYLMDGMIYASIMYLIQTEFNQLIQLHLLDMHLYVYIVILFTVVQCTMSLIRLIVFISLFKNC